MDTQFHVNFAKQETKILTKFRQGRGCLVRVDPEGAGERGGWGPWALGGQELLHSEPACPPACLDSSDQCSVGVSVPTPSLFTALE